MTQGFRVCACILSVQVESALVLILVSFNFYRTTDRGGFNCEKIFVFTRHHEVGVQELEGLAVLQIAQVFLWFVSTLHELEDDAT